MPYLLLIFIKSVVLSGLFYCWYVAVLRNKRMHQYNRFYLLTAVGLSLLLPFMQFTIHVGEQVQSHSLARALNVINRTDEKEIVTAATGQSVQLTDIATIIYIVAAMFFLIRIGRACYLVIRQKNKNDVQVMNGVSFVVTNSPAAPFSFMRTLYWRADVAMDSDEGRRMMQHELAHIRQYHSIDKLAMEVITALCWVNPFYHLMKRELNTVHEFIADEEAVGDDVPAFAAMLLSAAGHNGNALVNSFYYSPIKRRLSMLTQRKDTRYGTMRKLSFIPLTVAAVCTFCFTTVARAESTHKKITVVLDAGHGGNDAGAIKGDVMEKTVTLNIVKRLAMLAKDYNIDVQLTRKGDEYPTLNQRAITSNNSSADMFVSIHLNKTRFNNHFDSDYMVYTSPGNAKARESAALASAIAGSMAIYKPQLANKNLWVLKQNTHPAVLIECGNMDKPDQLQLLQDSKKLDELCRSILTGLAVYANSN